jgi:broad specificity phosphatase PhoE
MARLFLIRHGRPSETWGGASSDPGLSELGMAQAEAAAAKLAAYGPLDVVSSPMRRCVETAAPYARLRGVSPHLEPRVSEVVAEPGVEDRPAWLQARFPWRDPGKLRDWASLEPALQAWRAQMLDYVSGIERDTAVFSHFIAINVITGAALRRDTTMVCKPDHASITELEVSDGALRFVAFGAEMQVDDVR